MPAASPACRCHKRRSRTKRIDEKAVEEEYVLDYLRSSTTKVDLNDVVAQWRDDLVAFGLNALSDDSTNPNG
jgi:hypothetical protein